ncbi:Na+/H+ antiporter NhaA [Bombella saccharophila]|uniref:Na(+)/H(+) antiporter NhaA n=1 Tax=Bombella saccharophila TaxID=2967338 RepID=A0ABT3W6V1_9PROT|nr:Na+/H+ antiporter NhaA [Bombella saccharophila]MCX5614800.1 Na+/H+ antiporter NhaA [Bombella saccharophila]
MMQKAWWRTADIAGPFLLLFMAIAGLIAANSPWQANYALLAHPMGDVHITGWNGRTWSLTLPSVIEAITLGPMTLFFLLITLELKKELVSGHLSQLRQCLLPCVSALGGVVVPALLYRVIAASEPALQAGWAIPIATDAAFTVPILLALGRYVSEGGRVWLMALAIFDDVLGILIIALFYGSTLKYGPLIVSAVLVGCLVYWGRRGIRALWPYSVAGCLLWGCLLVSGVHPTIAGVVVGLCLPARVKTAPSPVERMEHYVTPWVRWVILPIFGFVIMGIPLLTLPLHAVNIRLVCAVAVGLVMGKTTGIFSATWLAVRCRLSPLPCQTSWYMVFGLSMLCGIGFTVSLFMASLSFAGSNLLLSAKLGILSGSLMAVLMGWVWLRAGVTVSE